MRDLFELLCELAKNHLDDFAADSAEAIRDGDTLHLLKNAVLFVLALLSMLVCGAVVVGLAYLGRRVLLPLVGIPTVVVLLAKSYFANQQDRSECHVAYEERALIEERAEGLYEYARNGIFLVLRAVSGHSSIISPTTPSSIETGARIYYRDGVPIYQFNALLSGEVKNVQELRQALDRALGQMLRNGEISGLPSRLVNIGGRNYTPVQILKLTDLGSSINIDVILTDEKSVALIERQRLLDVKKQKKSEEPYDVDF